jgi:hypothetical protein
LCSFAISPDEATSGSGGSHVATACARSSGRSRRGCGIECTGQSLKPGNGSRKSSPAISLTTARPASRIGTTRPASTTTERSTSLSSSTATRRARPASWRWWAPLHHGCPAPTQILPRRPRPHPRLSRRVVLNRRRDPRLVPGTARVTATLRAQALRATFGLANVNWVSASGFEVRAILANACTSLATPVRRALASSQLR